MQDLSHFATDPIAIPVLALMRDGRWRKARDATKDLCKLDRSRYLPLLIESNVGLAQELIGKGLPKDAITVIAYLETIAPAEVVAGLRAALAAPVAVAAPTAEPGNAGMALTWAAVLRADAALARGSAAAPTDLAEVDSLVVDGFCPTPDAEQAQRVAAELAAVRVACDATGDGNWEAAQEALRGVPGQSVFRHWRMFLRGVRCVFQDQPDTVRQCFSGLPAAGALARAARALAPDGIASGPVAPPAARVPLFLAMTGQPAAWAPLIVAAHTAVKAGKGAKAFTDLCAGMKGAFPAVKPGLPALLTVAVLPFHSRMKAADYSIATRLEESFDVWDDRKARKEPESILAVAQPLCLAEAGSMKPATLESYWGRVVEMWNRCEGPHPLRDSLAWQWLGETLPRPAQGLGPLVFGRLFGFGAPTAEFKKIRTALDKAVHCDPTNEAAWLALIALLEQQDDTKARNRLVDDLAKRFPNNKDILRRAGTLAVDRKAYDKGLTALRAALALDPLDKAVREQIVIALVLQLREYLKKARSVATFWEQMEPFLEDRAGRGHFMLVRWLARVRQAVLDPVPETAAAAFEDAVRLAPTALERLLAESLLASVYQVKSRSAWQPDWSAALAAGGHRWATLARMFELHDFLSNIKGWDWQNNTIAAALETQLGSILVADGLKTDLEGLLPFFDQLDAFYELDKQWLTKGLNVVAELLTHAVRKLKTTGKSRPDLRLRMAAFIIDERRAGGFVTASAKGYQDLAALAAEAIAAGMPEVAARAEALIQRWKRSENYDSDNFDSFDDSDLDEDDDDDEEYDGLMEDLKMAVLANDHAAVAATRKALKEFGLIDFELNAIIAGIRRAAPKPAKKPQPPPTGNPNQPDLF